MASRSYHKKYAAIASGLYDVICPIMACPIDDRDGAFTLQCSDCVKVTGAELNTRTGIVKVFLDIDGEQYYSAHGGVNSGTRFEVFYRRCGE